MLTDELDFETDLNYLNLSINSNLFCDNDSFLLKKWNSNSGKNYRRN